MNDRLWELEVDVNLVTCRRRLIINVINSFCFQNGVIRSLLLAFRFLGRDKGGRGGVVVNIGSSCSSRPMVSLPVFTATKHAIATLTRCYGDQYHTNLTGVRVLSVCPPPTESALTCEPRKRLLSADYEHAWQADVGNILPLK